MNDEYLFSYSRQNYITTDLINFYIYLEDIKENEIALFEYCIHISVILFIDFVITMNDHSSTTMSVTRTTINCQKFEFNLPLTGGIVVDSIFYPVFIIDICIFKKSNLSVSFNLFR